VGRVGDLGGANSDALGGQVVLIGPAEIAHARGLVERRAEQIRGWTDPHGRLDRNRMPMIETACRFCPFTVLCGADAGASAGTPSHS
jgi:hypothetical protein